MIGTSIKWGAGLGVLVGIACAIPPTPLNIETETSSGATESGVTAASVTGSGSGSSGSSTGTSVGATAATTEGVIETSSTTSVVSEGSTSTTGEPVVGTDESSSGGLECGTRESMCGGACCVDAAELCVADACEPCGLVIDFSGLTDTDGWMATGDWREWTGAPQSTNLPVPFPDFPAYGTDGNRDTMEPTENENSQALSHLFMVGDELRFRSWHVDEGGTGFYDNKVVQIYVGGMDHTLVNCFDGVNPQSFCSEVMGPRSQNDWDDIVLDTSMWSGMMVRLRLQYLSGSNTFDFEQGWYIDDIRTGQECGPLS